MVGVLVSGALLVVCWAGNAGATSRAGTVAPWPYLHVVIPPKGSGDATPYLADQSGRQVLLHGAAVVGMEDVAYPNADGGPALVPVSARSYDGRCPAATARLPEPPLCEVQAGKSAYRQSTAAGTLAWAWARSSWWSTCSCWAAIRLAVIRCDI